MVLNGLRYVLGSAPKEDVNSTFNDVFLYLCNLNTLPDASVPGSSYPNLSPWPAIVFNNWYICAHKHGRIHSSIPQNPNPNW